MLAFLNHMTTRGKFFILLALFAVGIAGAALNGYINTENVRIGSPIYDRVVANKDIVADVLPPPLYIVESKLVAHEMLNARDASELDALRRRSKSLREEFETRHAAWSRDLDDGELKRTLLVAASEAGREFFEVRDAQFVPAIQRGDLDKARAILVGPMTQAYERHRTAVDRVVVLAKERTDKEEALARQTITAGRERTVLGAAIIFAIIFALAMLIATRISQSLRRSVDIMRDVAEGGGDLTKRLDDSGGDEVAEMARWFNAFVERLHDIVTELRVVATEVSTASEQLSTSAEEISSGAQEQAASLEETAASLEKITCTVKQTSDNTQRATELVRSCGAVADKGGKVVEATVAAMHEISTSSRKIADISGTIDEIAFQTNLLALNAAVEAARAGDQGRGFAVVAGEVRSLAQRSAGAAREIKMLIGISNEFVEGGRTQVNQSGVALEEIVTSVRRVTDVVGEIATAAREQRLGVEEVNAAVARVDHVVQGSAARTQEMAATAEILAEQAAQVTALVRRFKLRGDQAADALRAAPAAISKGPRARARKPLVLVPSETRLIIPRAPTSLTPRYVVSSPPGARPTGTSGGFESF